LGEKNKKNRIAGEDRLGRSLNLKGSVKVLRTLKGNSVEIQIPGETGAFVGGHRVLRRILKKLARKFSKNRGSWGGDAWAIPEAGQSNAPKSKFPGTQLPSTRKEQGDRHFLRFAVVRGDFAEPKASTGAGRSGLGVGRGSKGGGGKCGKNELTGSKGYGATVGEGGRVGWGERDGPVEREKKNKLGRGP